VKQELGRWVVIDAGQKWDDVQEELRKVITNSLIVGQA